ncbi:hypothetical protein PPROV_000496900 [Pycnococcus provasolii]|uniref:Cyclin N-terminal domain-containing protein n=1 Tax=Pycnococcus provasolii TaxID=41880 RepID=A0A830HHF6_9CHLO|nr:hypothetical protein PPROV_000496900 [Pycnococcus provasolii]
MAAFTMEDEALMRAIDPTTFTTLLAKIVDVHTDGAKTNAHEPPAKRMRTSSNGQASTSYAEVVVTGVIDAKEAAERRKVEAAVRGDFVDIVEVDEQKLHMQNLCPAYDDDHWGADMNASARIVQRVAAITKVLIRLPAKIAPSQEGEVALPKSSYMTSQHDINSTMRAILVDWLLEVAWDVGDYEEVIFYATNYLDRCLSTMQMTRSKLQLLGVACMLVANKYHGHQTMSADDCKSYTDNAYECKELIDMEQIVLQTLNFQLDMRTSYSYLRKYLRSLLLPSTGDLKHSEFTSDARLSNLSRYLLDLTLLDIHFLDYEPTKVAASALLVALYTLNGKCPETLLRHTGHTRVSLRECATSVHAAYVEHACAHGAVLLANYAAREIPALYKKRDAKELHALHKMYAKERLNRVSKLHPPRALSDSLFQA